MVLDSYWLTVVRSQGVGSRAVPPWPELLARLPTATCGYLLLPFGHLMMQVSFGVVSRVLDK